MKRIMFFIPFTFLIINHSISQNLILDNSFEIFDDIYVVVHNNKPEHRLHKKYSWPLGVADSYSDTDWIKYSSKDIYIYYDSCTHKAQDSFSYVELKVIGIPTYTVHQYLEAPLKTKLIKDMKYNFKMYVRLSNNPLLFGYETTNQIGVSFTNKPLWPFFQPEEMHLIKPYINNNEETFYTDTLNWTLFSGSFIAKGDERFIIVGNFTTDENSPILKLKKSRKKILRTKGIWFDIDNLSLFADSNYLKNLNNDTDKFMKINKDEDFKEGIGYVFNNIEFEYGSSALLKESYPVLDTLVDILKSNTQFNIEIQGHTDSIGNDTYNQLLSLNRATSVSDYLISQGISKDRITVKSFGSTKPLTINNTEEGRKKNRRVEFYFIKK